VITYVTNTRGVLLQDSWAGKCLEPPDNCPTSCDIRVVGTMTFQTCYKCDVDETCRGSFLFQRSPFKPFCNLDISGIIKTNVMLAMCGICRVFWDNQHDMLV